MSAFAQAWPCFSIESLFCALDDLILQRFAQIAEMITVSGDPDDQICMLLRVQLRIDQCLCAFRPFALAIITSPK